MLILGTLALATVGTVFSAISSQARMRELLLPLLLLPLLTPALIASTEATAGLFEDHAVPLAAVGRRCWSLSTRFF